ncbi:MAG: DUF6263 family protein [Phycisphaerae bacterium]
MTTIRALVCVLIAAIATAGQEARAAQPDAIDLKFVYRTGRTTRQRVVSRTVGSMKLFDPLPEQKFAQTFEQELTLTCRRVNPDGSAALDITMDRVAMQMSIGGLNMEFDSAAPATQPDDRLDTRMLARIFSAMLGSTLTVIVGPDGQPARIEGVKQFKEKMLNGLADEPVPASLRKLLDQVSGMFDDETMMKEMQSSYRLIPNERKRVGDRWERSWNMKIPLFNGRIDGQGRYELLAIEEFRGRKCAKIGVKESFHMAATPEVAAPAEANASAPAKGIVERLRFDLKAGGGGGTAYWDYENGELVQLRQVQRLTMEISMPTDAATDGSEPGRGKPAMVQKLTTAESVDLLDDAPARGRGDVAASAPAPTRAPQ